MTIKWTGARLATTRARVEGKRPPEENWVVCRHTCAWQPPMDVYEDDEGLVVQIEVAGMRSEDFSISLAGQTLVIAGARADSTPKQTYHQIEIRFGEFRAEVDLPWPVEQEDVEASYEDGFLRVQLSRPAAWRVQVVGVEQQED